MSCDHAGKIKIKIKHLKITNQRLQANMSCDHTGKIKIKNLKIANPTLYNMDKTP